jgi:hypothetical protein
MESGQNDHETLRDHLMAANRVLVTLSAIDPRERTTLMSPAIRECMAVYSDLLRCEIALSLSATESASLQGALGRLKAYLSYFGEDV